MTEINSESLKKLRDRAGLTLDDLAKKAKVDRGTISRIENGKVPKCRAETVRRLSDALGVEPEVLTGPLPEDDDARIFGRKSAMKMRIADDARNALALVATRYGVKPTAIVHLAPFLFLWAAEESLKRRGQKLVEVSQHLDALFAVKAPDHLSYLMIDNWRGEDIMEAERRSIAHRDIFGTTIPDDALPPQYEEEEQNPMAKFLASLASELDGQVDFDSWSPHWDRPMYHLGQEEADKLTGGDRLATLAIVQGAAPLHAMPKQVREAGPNAVAEWANEERKRSQKEMLGDFDFGFDDDDQEGDERHD